MTKAQMLFRVVTEARVHPNGMIEIPPDLWNEVCEAGSKLTLGECRRGDVVVGPEIGDFCVISNDPGWEAVFTTSGMFPNDTEVTDVIRYA